MEKRRKNRIVLSRRYSDTRFRNQMEQKNDCGITADSACLAGRTLWRRSISYQYVGRRRMEMSLKPSKKSDMGKSWMKPRRDKSILLRPEYHLIVTEGTTIRNYREEKIYEEEQKTG